MHSFKYLTIASLIVAGTWSVTVATAHAEDWGAIAIDTFDGTAEPAVGVGGADTPAEASKSAIKYCGDYGGKNCKVMITYQQCGAVASNGKTAGFASADTKEIAEKTALSQCGDKSCKIVTSDCN